MLSVFINSVFRCRLTENREAGAIPAVPTVTGSQGKATVFQTKGKGSGKALRCYDRKPGDLLKNIFE